VTHGDYYQENVYAIVIKKMSKVKFKIKIILLRYTHPTRETTNYTRDIVIKSCFYRLEPRQVSHSTQECQTSARP